MFIPFKILVGLLKSVFSVDIPVFSVDGQEPIFVRGQVVEFILVALKHGPSVVIEINVSVMNKQVFCQNSFDYITMKKKFSFSDFLFQRERKIQITGTPENYRDKKSRA